MKLAFRMDCPHCKWGREIRDQFINQGWLVLTCSHCDKKFYARITVTGFDLQVVGSEEELPEDHSPIKQPPL